MIYEDLDYAGSVLESPGRPHRRRGILADRAGGRPHRGMRSPNEYGVLADTQNTNLDTTVKVGTPNRVSNNRDSHLIYRCRRIRPLATVLGRRRHTCQGSTR